MTLAYIGTALAGVLFIGSQVAIAVQHRRWMRDGDVLSKRFDDLMHERETRLDPLVHEFDRASAEERESIRADVTEWFDRMEAQQAARADWARRAR